MATAGDVLEMGPLGIRVEFLRSSQETDGELVETEISGHPRGFLDQRHVHERQIERIEVVSGAMKVAMHGVEHVLTEGESIEIPAGTPHRQVPIGKGVERSGFRSVLRVTPKRFWSGSRSCAEKGRSRAWASRVRSRLRS
jgi:hypothetical protein